MPRIDTGLENKLGTTKKLSVIRCSGRNTRNIMSPFFNTIQLTVFGFLGQGFLRTHIERFNDVIHTLLRLLGTKFVRDFEDKRSFFTCGLESFLVGYLGIQFCYFFSFVSKITQE